MTYIRNFCIIAHVDHGKSTLADRFLELTGTIPEREMRDQYLDRMDLERERGITIKLQPVRMHYKESKDSKEAHLYKQYQLNLIDTPGHTDFRYEVSRSLAAVEGAILLVDASQGVQAQTLATLSAAREQGLTIVPVINKIDLPTADVPRVTREVAKLLSCHSREILPISAKEGRGVEEVLRAVIERILPPKGSQRNQEIQGANSTASSASSSSRALIFDAVADAYRGVVAYVRVFEGCFRRGDRVHLLATRQSVEVSEVGSFAPQYHPEEGLFAGEIGYIVTGLKEVAEARTGDTVASSPDLPPLPGYRPVQPMVFAGLYPTEGDDVRKLRAALEKLRLSDAALTVEPEHNAALGHGFRCGFLGLLHLDIVQERLEREFACDLIVTAPSVEYEVVLRSRRPASCVRSSLLVPGAPNIARISNPADFPDPSLIEEVREPWISLEILSPSDAVGSIMGILQERRGVSRAIEYLEADRVLLRFEAPLQSIILDFFDKLKSLTAGYGSMSYTVPSFRAGALVKLQILLVGEPIEALSTIVHRSEAEKVGRLIAERLKEVVPKQQFAVPIQAAVGSRIVARETLPAMRKDVTGYLYGGDVSRKKKLLEKQKKGKKRMKAMGKVLLPQEAFLSMLQR